MAITLAAVLGGGAQQPANQPREPMTAGETIATDAGIGHGVAIVGGIIAILVVNRALNDASD